MKDETEMMIKGDDVCCLVTSLAWRLVVFYFSRSHDSNINWVVGTYRSNL